MSNELLLDLGNLAAFDGRLGLEGDPRERATDGTERLVHAIFALESEDTDDGRVTKLPAGSTMLPREKCIPEPREPTKWEKFMKGKGITKRRRDRLVWDEVSGEYLPRYGKRGVKSLGREWIIPDKGNLHPGEDPFEQRKLEKRRKIEDNKRKREANIRKGGSLKNPTGKRKLFPISSMDVAPIAASGKKRVPKERLNDSISVVQRSTASAGRFDVRRKNEPKPVLRGKKRKFDPVAESTLSKEKDRAMRVAERMLQGAPT